MPQARGAAPWPPLGAVPFNSYRRCFWWSLQDGKPPRPAFVVRQIGRRESSRGGREVVFWQAKSGRYCCLCLQGLLRCHYRDMLAACGRPNRLSRPLHVRVRVRLQNPEPRTELVSCCPCLPSENGTMHAIIRAWTVARTSTILMNAKPSRSRTEGAGSATLAISQMRVIESCESALG